jgi:hypothetical protein
MNCAGCNDPVGREEQAVHVLGVPWHHSCRQFHIAQAAANRADTADEATVRALHEAAFGAPVAEEVLA